MTKLDLVTNNSLEMIDLDAPNTGERQKYGINQSLVEGDYGNEVDIE